MKHLFLFFIFSLSVEAVVFPVGKHEDLSEDQQQILLQPFLQEKWRVDGMDYSLSPVDIQVATMAQERMSSFLEAYKRTFINARSIKTAKDPENNLMTAFQDATESYHGAILYIVSSMTTLYTQSHKGAVLESGFLKKLSEQNYADSFKQFQRMTLSVLSYLHYQDKAQVTYPYGTLQNIKGMSDRSTLHYFWDAQGPVPFFSRAKNLHAHDLIKLPYGEMKVGVPRTIIISPEGEVIAAKGIYLREGERGIEVSAYNGLSDSMNSLKNLNSKSSVDLEGVQIEDPSFTGYIGESGSSLTNLILEHHRDYARFKTILGDKKNNLVPLPTQQELELMYLDWLDEIIENPSAEGHQEAYQALLGVMRELPALEAAEEGEENPAAALVRMRDEVKQSLLDQIMQADPQKDMAQKNAAARAHLTKQTKKQQSRKKHTHRQKTQPSSSAGSAATGGAAAASLVDPERSLEDLRKKSRLKFSSLGKILNQQARQMGRSGSHFMQYVRHKLTRRGSHLTVGDQTIAQPHGSKDSKVPARFIESFVEGVVQQFHNQGERQETARAAGVASVQ
jgi:hypothetical protein